jgi:hypothetical protein
MLLTVLGIYPVLILAGVDPFINKEEVDVEATLYVMYSGDSRL